MERTPFAWFIEVPKSGYNWFERSPERIRFWVDRKDATVTPLYKQEEETQTVELGVQHGGAKP